jgi:hypothetical protein
MIKTIKKSTKNIVKAGSPQVQPTKIFAKDLSVLEDKIISEFINSDNQAKDPTKISSIANIGDSVIEKAGKLNKVALKFAPAKNDKFSKRIPAVFNKKFSPYESLVGISQERPEIISLMNFLPIAKNPLSLEDIVSFQQSDNLTKAGKYFLTQILANEVNVSDVIYLVEKINRTYSLQGKNILKLKNQEFINSMSNLDDLSKFLLDITVTAETLRENLDLRNENYASKEKTGQQNVSPISVGSKTINTLKGAAFIESLLPLSIFSILEKFGFNKSNIEKFSSTKLWMQLLHETKHCLLHYSDSFNDEKSTKKLLDSNAYNTLIEEKKYFTIANDKKIESLQTLSSIETHGAIDFYTNSLVSAWKSLYRNLKHSDSEFVICNLANFCSKEARYSNAFSDKSSVSNLSNEGYTILEDNADAFDFIFGDTEFSLDKISPDELNTPSNLSFDVPSQNTAVLLFETRYIENKSSVYTPGYAYYVDSIYEVKNNQLNLDKFNMLLSKIANSNSRLTRLLSAMNVVNQSLNVDSITSKNRDEVYNQNTFLKNLLYKISSASGITNASVSNDNIAGIYSLAKKDARLKSLLFLLTLFRAIFNKESEKIDIKLPNFSTSIESQPDIINKIVDKIVSHLIQKSNKTLNFDTTNQAISKVSINALKQALKKGTYTTRIIDDFIKLYYSSLNRNAFVDDLTKFRQVQDTSLLMAIFDICINSIYEFSNKNLKYVGYFNTTQTSKQVVEFIFETTNRNNSEKIKSILSRIDSESRLEKDSVNFIFSVLNKLQQTFNSANLSFTSKDSVSKINKIVSSLDSNEFLFKSLMNEQQIQLLVSNLLDASSMLKNRNKADSETSLMLLDNAVVHPKLKNALLSIFSTRDFDEEFGFNKKIISVGIPSGFSKNLNLKSSVDFRKKKQEQDIISVNVYKTDLQNPDLIYKPIKFLFELSRFPVRDNDLILSIKENSTIDDICESIPTRDFSQENNSSSDIYYFNKSSSAIDSSKKQAMSSQKYSFLKFKQKQEIIKNHVLSYLCESYIKIMTNINIGDYVFLLDPLSTSKIDPAMISQISRNFIDLVKGETNNNANNTQTQFSKLPKIFLSATPKEKNVASLPGFNPIVKNLTSTQPQQSLTQNSRLSKISDLYSHGFKVMDSIKNLTSNLMNEFSLLKTFINPKKFDRVFNVIIDPDDFEIDYEETVKTSQGKSVFENLLSRNDVIQQPITGKFLYKDRMKTKDDIVMEKYFVTIETFGDDVI